MSSSRHKSFTGSIDVKELADGADQDNQPSVYESHELRIL